MYSKEYRIIYTLLIFFSVGTADEVLRLMEYNRGIVSVIYLGMMIYTIFNYGRFTEGKYLWDGAFPIIGLFALIKIISVLFNFYTPFFMKADSIVSIMVWLKCVHHLNNYEKNKDQEDESIEEV